MRQSRYSTATPFPYPRQDMAITAAPDRWWLTDNGSDPKTFGIDVSKWQGSIDYHQCFQDGVKFAAMRCTVGDYYTDVRFAENWEGFGAAGILRTPYIVVAPAWSAEWNYKRVSAQAHWDDFMKVFGDREPELPIALDCELSRNQSPAYISDLIDELIWMIEGQFNRMPIIYTRGNWWNENTVPRSSFGECDLWIARYNTAIEHPWEDNDIYRPRDWEDWTFWQYSEEGSIEGVPNAHVDLDWYNGTLEHLLEYSELEPVPPDPDPPPVDPELEQRVATLEANYQALAIQVNTLQVEMFENKTAISKLEKGFTLLTNEVAKLKVLSHQHEAKDTVTATVTGDKVLACYVYDYNKVPPEKGGPKPMMAIYEPRKKFTTGQTFEVYPGLIDADGTRDYYQMEITAEGVALFCRADKVQV